MSCFAWQINHIPYCSHCSLCAIIFITVFGTLAMQWASCCSDSASNFSDAVGNVFEDLFGWNNNNSFLFFASHSSIFSLNVCVYAQCFALNKSQHQPITRSRFIPFYSFCLCAHFCVCVFYIFCVLKTLVRRDDDDNDDDDDEDDDNNNGGDGSSGGGGGWGMRYALSITNSIFYLHDSVEMSKS